MLLIEVILIAVFLASIAIGTSYFFAQTKVTMRSSSQVMGCQTIAKQALESVVSLGTRLYGYRIHDQSGKLSYEPLFIKDSGGSVVDVGSGSELSFPPKMYKTLYENLGVSPPTQGPKTNTGVPLIGATYPFEISTSTLIVNSVNALQYLYNSESGFFTVKGKMYTNSGGQISSVLKKHKDQFDLKDIKFYIRIAPINLQTEKEVTSPPSKILTRPRFHNPQKVKLSPALKVLGDPDIGFEIKVTLEYTRSDQEYTCDAMHRFTHQIKPIMSKPSKEIHAAMTSLTSEAGEDFLTTPGLLLTSCDTDGVGYDDIAVTVNFNGIEPSQQIGTVILCQMNSYCRSLGNDSYNDCSPELGEWQRCHDIKPTGSDQSWTYTSELEKPQVLKMKFGGMKIDRRYELYVGEFSMAGRKIREKRVSRFYIDAIRPGVNPSITNDAVGAPDDGTGDRNYNGPFTDWKVPDNASSGKWIQCNQQAVTFEGNITDQFTHNLEDCELEGKREDGSGSTTTSPTKKPPCSGELNGIQQGRQTITFIPSDTCGKSPNPGELVWDTDLPSSFEAKDFADPIWLYSGNPYPIKTIVPSKDLAGNFPKHYSVDCTDNFLGTRTREDGDSGQLSCKLGPSNPDHDDGCNPAVMIAQYHHVCGGVGSSVCKNTTWGVYVPLGESCVNVWCEPSLGCCDLSRGTCDGVPHKQCGDPKTRECTDPVGGTQGPEHEVPSDCPPLGLNHCSYYLPCEPTAPYGNLPQPTPPRTFCDGSVSHAPSGCGGLREGDECGIILIPYDCGSGSGPGWQWQDSPPPIEKGLCYNSIDSSESPMIPSNTGGCNCTSVVVRRCKPPGVIQYIVSDSICSGGVSGTCTSGSCSAGGTCSGGDGSPCEEEGTCSASQPGTWSNPPSADGTCSLNGSSCAADVEEVCTTNWEYKLSATGECPPVPIPSGICGEASGGCSRRAGGGNLGSEQCDPRSSACLPPGVVPHPCNSSAECCVGDTYASNPAHCPSDCVKKQGKACCLVSEGGDCSGQFCAANCANSAGCHVREVNNDGVCRPSCGGLAKAQGFAGDGTSDTSTWTHSATSCSDLNTQQLWGSTNWMKIPLIDNKEPSESVTIGGECCARSPSLCDSDKECCDTDTYQTNPDHCSLDGRCGGVSGDLCNTGNAEPSNPNRMTDTWICKGENEGKDSGTCCDTSKNTTCVPAPLENGTCGTGSNLCTVGDPKPSSPNRTTETWICEGKDGGEDSGTCCDSSNPFCSSQNGVCGSPCTVGDREDIDGTKWKCKGVGGGTNSGVCLIDGMCSDTGCSSGTKQPTNPLPNESWICKSIGGGSDSGTCPRSGECNTAGCAVGTKQDINAQQWKCEGISGGGSSETCGCNPASACCPGQTYADNPTHCSTEGIDGVCGSTHTDPCSAGDSSPSFPAPTATWICEGKDGGGDSATCCDTQFQGCSPGNPVDGVCNISGDDCAQGDRYPTSGGARWSCTGIMGGKSSGCCDSNRTCCPDDTHQTNPTHCPEDGKCGSPCAVGDPDPNPPPSSGTWVCKGKNGGGDSSTCGCNPAVKCCPGQTCTDNPTHCACPSALPVCGGYDHSASQGTCTEGSFVQLGSTQTEHQWKCNNTDGKSVTCPAHNKCNCGSCPQPTPPQCCDSTATCCPGDTNPPNLRCPAASPECGSTPFGYRSCDKGSASLRNTRCVVHSSTPFIEYEWTCTSGSNTEPCFYEEEVECCSSSDCLSGTSCNLQGNICGSISCNQLTYEYDFRVTCEQIQSGWSCIKQRGCWVPESCIAADEYETLQLCDRNKPSNTTCQRQGNNCWKGI